MMYPTKIELHPGAEPHQATLTVEPLTQGYGTTIGNALRRVLLSSLPGAAVTAVKIKGATHEFTTLPNVKEDILEILLQIKLLRLKSFSESPVTLTLKADGKRKVTAKDISPNADVEIANPKLHLVTLTDASASLEMEFIVERGTGYSPTEERGKRKLDLGMIAVDALFSPVVNVGFKVENVRVGEITNFDKLVLTVETDGTITPKQAIEDSVKLLMNHYALLQNIGEARPTEEAPAAAEEEVSTPEEPSAPAAGEESEEKPKKRGRKKSTEE